MALGAGGVIDQFFVALGFRIDERGAKDFKKKTDEAKEQLLSVGTAIKAFIAGQAIRGIASIGSSFESNTNAIAAMLATLGKSSDFNAGLVDAEKTINRIVLDAAKLPGTAEEYIEVFKMGLPSLIDAMPGASADEIAAFTNRLTAIGTSILQVDAPQLGRDLQLMLGSIGRAGGHVKTFAQLLGYLKKLPGQANLTAQGFNAMSQPARLKLLQDVLFNPNLSAGLKRAETSFDAMAGAAKSMVTTLVRKSTIPLFEGMKTGLDELNKMFFTADGELTPLGKDIVDTIKTISEWVFKLVRAGGGFIKMLLESEHGTKILKVGLVALGSALAGLALTKAIDLFSKLTKILLNPKLLLIGALAVAIALIAEDLYVFLKGGKSVIGMLKNKFPVAFALVAGGLTALAALFVALKLAAVASAIAAALSWAAPLAPILLVIGAIGLLIGMFVLAYKKWPAFAAFVDQTAHGFVVMAEAIERAVTALREFLGLQTHESEPFRQLADSAGTYDRRVGVTDAAGEPTFLQRPATMTGADAGVTKSVTTTSGKQVQVHVDRPHVVIQTNDPQKMGQEFHRQVTREGQKAYK